MEPKDSFKVDGQFTPLTRGVMKDTFDAAGGGGGYDLAATKVLLKAALIVVIIGKDLSKALLRKDFFVDKVGLIRFCVIFILMFAFGAAFIVESIFAFLHWDDDPLSVMMGYDRYSKEYLFSMSFSFFISGLIFIWLSFYCIRKAIKLRRRSKQNDASITYQGGSDVLGFLPKHRILFEEPLYLIIIAGLSTFANIFGGIPMLFAAISIWLFRLMEVILPSYFLPTQNNKADQPTKAFTEVE